MTKLTPRQYLIMLHDVLAAAAAIAVTFVMRFDAQQVVFKLHGLEIFLPLFVIYAAAVFFFFKLHQSKWRFTSVPDVFNIVRASTVLAVSLVALDYVLLSPNVYGEFFFGKITIVLYWVLQMFFLGGGRIAYRYLHYARTLQRVRVADAAPTLILGRTADAEVLIRAIESGAVKKIWPVGILSPSQSDRGQSIRSIPVLGDPGDLESVAADLVSRGTHVTRVVMAPSAMTPDARPESILMRARRLGLALSQMPSLDGGPAVQLLPVSVED
ncbi:MAG: capsular biosynthesis protein, partial [Proteobacteria bacterium]|nr:capsular biosynthesis protein [Pseudomonadota bacterium]